MNSIRIENLRSLQDTGPISLSPLTILLGNNSSGKSTFLRTFPLLKQSFQEKILGPISFFGSLVDFGNFDTAITRNNNNNTISISLEFDISERDFLILYSKNAKYKNKKPVKIKFDFKKYETSDVLYISKCIIKIVGENLILSFSDSNTLKQLLLNEKDYTYLFPNTKISYKYGHFFPLFQIEKNNIYSKHNIFMKPLIELLNGKSRKGKEDERVIFYYLRNFELFPICGKDFSLELLSNSFFYDEDTRDICKKLNNKEIGIDIFSEYLFLSQIPRLLQTIENYLFKEFKNLFYSKPLRANAERYYRIQPLAVDEVSADGRNIISFINNLNDLQKVNFVKWINSNFDFEIKIETYVGHQSLLIKNNCDEDFSNISDMGFGYSQIIPIITQLWSLTEKISHNDDMENSYIFAIEQPELHLHPKMQRELIKAFCSVIKLAREHKIDVKIILETHSEKMINYLGEMVEEKTIANKDISILLFEKVNKVTDIRTVLFNDKGYLVDWPINFF